MFLKGRKFKPAFEEFLLAKNINHDEQMMLFCHHSAQRLLLTYDDIFSYVKTVKTKIRHEALQQYFLEFDVFLLFSYKADPKKVILFSRTRDGDRITNEWVL